MKKKKRNKRFLWPIEYLAASAVLALVRLLPIRTAIRMGGALGRLAFAISKRHHAITIDNLTKSFRDKGPDEIRAIARSVYTGLGYQAVEFMRSDRYAGRKAEDFFSFVNYEAILKAQSRGKGVLLLTGHCGSWELMAMAQALKGRPFGIVVRPLDNPYLERAVTNIRTRFGNKLINKKSGMREILRTLEGGGLVGILLDQNVSRKEGVFVDFFGRPACTNKGLALIAKKTGAPVIPAFTRRTGLCTHEILAGDEMPLIDTGDKEADIIANTQAYTRVIEDFIRENPDQWFWMHRRWKTAPERA